MDLANRPQLEARFARRLGTTGARHRRELIELLGNPPDERNVPQSFWDKVEQETAEDLLFFLLLIFAASSTQHGLDSAASKQAAQDFAATRAPEVARSFTQTSQERLSNATTRWQEQAEAARKRAADAAKAAGESEAAQRRAGQSAADDAISKSDIADEATKIFGPSRVEGVAVSETTGAASAGGELGTIQTVGITDDDTWFTAHDARVCKICAPLHGKKRSYWSRFFPNGPPAHVNCRCWIRYANEGLIGQEAA